MAFCENCGVKLEEGAAFCPNCGTRVAAAETAQTKTANQSGAAPVYAAPVYTAPVYSAPVYNEQANAVNQKKDFATGSFVLAIVAACLASFGLPGLIMGIIGLNKVKKFYGEGGKGYWKTIITKALSIYAIIVGSIMTLYFAIIILAALAGSAAYSVNTGITEFSLKG